MLLEINDQHPEPRKIGQAVSHLQRGGIIVYPTDSSYAFGCDPNRRKAVETLLRIRQMPKNKRMSLICSDLSQVSQYGYMTNNTHKLLKRCLPGPYTFVLTATKLVPRIMLTKQKTIGIRIPDTPIALALVEAMGHPIITSTVKNNDTDQEMMDPEEIEKVFGHAIQLTIDAGLIFPEPSSIVDLSDEVPEVLREGKGDVSFFLDD